MELISDGWSTCTSGTTYSEGIVGLVGGSVGTLLDLCLANPNPVFNFGLDEGKFNFGNLGTSIEGLGFAGCVVGINCEVDGNGDTNSVGIASKSGRNIRYYEYINRFITTK